MSWTALAAAGVTALSGVANSASTGKMNKKNRKFSEKMWNKQNEYNHPVAQMARLKEAGLNPHLVYGQSSGGTAGNADAPKVPEGQAPKIGSGFADAVTSYVANRRAEQEIENMKSTIESQNADISLKGQQQAKLAMDTAKTDIEVQQARELYNNTIEVAHQNLENLKKTGTKMDSDIANTIADTIQKGVQTEKIKVDAKHTGALIKKVTQEIEESKARINNLLQQNKLYQLDGTLKQLDINLRRQGINPSDPTWQRVLVQMLSGTGLIDKDENVVKKAVSTPWLKLLKGLWSN